MIRKSKKKKRKNNGKSYPWYTKKTMFELSNCYFICLSFLHCRNDSDGDAIWMIGPLISKLPSQVQGRVLKLAGSKLEGGNNFLSSKGGKFDKDNRGKRRYI